MKKILNLSLAAFLFACFFAACVDQEFDVPPAVEVQTADLSNTTIADLKNLHDINGNAVRLEDQIIKGVVVSDDTDGNIFKEMVIQDESAAIHIRVDQTDLNVKFPRGRLVYVHCKDLYLGNYNGLKQLGVAASDENVNRVPAALVDSFFTIGPKDQEIVVYDRTINSLTTADLSRLIRFSDVEFNIAEVGGTMADASGSGAQNRTIEDCDGNSIILRNSDYSDLASAPIPSGGGTLTAIYTTFGDTKQLAIRDMGDVVMEGTRCDGGGGGGGGGTGDLMSISSLRDAFNSGASVAPDGFIQGIVISDVNSQNTVDRNLYIQDGDSGIAVRFDNSHSFALGSSLKITVSGVELSEFSGLLQLNDTPNGNVEVIADLPSISPREVCVEDLLDNLDQYESTLVRLNGVSLAGGGTFNGNTTVSDMSGSIPMFTRMDASFSGDALPSVPADLIAVVSNFNGAQVFLRNGSDVLAGTTSDCTGGGGGGGNMGDPVDSVDEGFDGQNDFDPIMISGWLNTVETGNRNWQKREFDGNGYAQATAFNDNDPNMETYLVTPPLNMDVITKLNFDSAKAFYTHDGLSVLISTDFDGSDVQSATWNNLNANIAQQSDTDHDFVNSGDVDLSAYDGTAYIAFRYTGNSGSDTGTFRVDNVKID